MKKKYFWIVGLLSLAMVFCVVSCPADGEEIITGDVVVDNEAVVDAAIAAVTAELGNLTGVATDRNLPTAKGGVSITWASDNTGVLSNTGVVTRPAAGSPNVTLTLTGTFTKDTTTKDKLFTVTVLSIPNDPELARRIKIEDIALGDLSTVDADILLPTVSGGYTVTWESSNTGILSDTGVVTRPYGAPVTATLTGTFTSTNDPGVKDVLTKTVRVMHTGAQPEDFLALDLQFEGGNLVNSAPSGNYYVPTVKNSSNSTISASTVLEDVNGYKVINFNGNYVDLGPKVGALLRKPEWTIEFYTKISADEGTMFSFANDGNINNTNQGSWRGTVSFFNPTATLGLANYGRYNHTNDGNVGNTNTNYVNFGRSSGLLNYLNLWMHVMITVSDERVNIYRIYIGGNGSDRLTANTVSNRATRLWTDQFGSGNEELEDLRFGYLGKSVFSGIPSNSNVQDSSIPGSIYGFKVYTKALVSGSSTEAQLPSDLVTPRQAVVSALRGQ